MLMNQGYEELSEEKELKEWRNNEWQQEAFQSRSQFWMKKRRFDGANPVFGRNEPTAGAKKRGADGTPRNPYQPLEEPYISARHHGYYDADFISVDAYM